MTQNNHFSEEGTWIQLSGKGKPMMMLNLMSEKIAHNLSCIKEWYIEFCSQSLWSMDSINGKVSYDDTPSTWLDSKGWEPMLRIENSDPEKKPWYSGITSLFSVWSSSRPWFIAVLV